MILHFCKHSQLKSTFLLQNTLSRPLPGPYQGLTRTLPGPYREIPFPYQALTGPLPGPYQALTRKWHAKKISLSGVPLEICTLPSQPSLPAPLAIPSYPPYQPLTSPSLREARIQKKMPLKVSRGGPLVVARDFSDDIGDHGARHHHSSHH